MICIVTWIHAGDRYPYLKVEPDHFLALDEAGADIGVVRLVESGPEPCVWLWAMVRTRSARPPFPRPRSGTTATRSEAAKALVSAWRSFRIWYMGSKVLTAAHSWFSLVTCGAKFNLRRMRYFITTQPTLRMPGSG